jgi:hypothetical protein
MLGARQTLNGPGPPYQDQIVPTVISISTSTDLILQPGLVYSAWSPIPEPSTALLLGLTGLAGKGRRRNHS